MKFVTFASWDDSPHLDADAKAGLMKSYLPHELEARTRGIPSLGSGVIYPVPEQEYVIEPIQFPAWYRHVYAMDVGWNRTAALWGAHDQENDVLYLYGEHYRGMAEAPVHAEAIKARGGWIPGVIDPASRGRSQKDGEALFDIYRELGLVLIPANNAREAGILEVYQRLSSGRLKIFNTLQNLRQEMRIYRRDDKGAVIKDADHLCDCLRYMCMTGISIAAIRPFEQWNARQGLPQFKKPQMESNYEPFAEAWAVAKGSPGASPNRDNWWPNRQK